MNTQELAVINVSKGVAIKTGGFGSFEAQPQHELGHSFIFDGAKFIVVTTRQAKAYEEVIDRQGFENHMDTYWSFALGCLMVDFPAISIGIEEDGYSHS